MSSCGAKGTGTPNPSLKAYVPDGPRRLAYGLVRNLK